MNAIGPNIVPLSHALRRELEQSGVWPEMQIWIHRLEATAPGGRLIYWDSPHLIQTEPALLSFFMRLRMLGAVELFQERAYEPRTDFVSPYLRYVALRRDGYVAAPGAAKGAPARVESVARSSRPQDHPRHGLAYFERRRSASGALSSR
jgi:hypothetical protein